MTLSKSDYLLYLKHPAWLWLKKFAKSKLPPIDANVQSLFAAGHDFEILVESLFPDSLKLSFDSFDQYDAFVAKTAAALKADCRHLFQARFQHQELTCVCDIISKNSDGSLNLYEIKTSTRPKPEHVHDLAFQAYVLNLCGFKVGETFVVHPNPDYVRGPQLDLTQLVKITPLTLEVKSLADATSTHVSQALALLSGPCPSLSPALCSSDSLSNWLDIYRSLVNLPSCSIFDLCQLTPELVAQLEAAHITRLVDIPDQFPLSPKQRLQVAVTRSGQPQINLQAISQFLASFIFPLHFLDYETMSTAIPQFPGLRPYQQLPIQYSLHVLDSPSSTPRHFQFLHTSSSHPAPALTASLKSHLAPTGSIVVWNANFEKSCHNLMGQLLPESADFYASLNERMVDLMLPFSQGHYAHADFHGSSSIKKVLPVLAPHLSYDQLPVKEGETAQRLWLETFFYGQNSASASQIAQDLLAYCRLDTLAMLEIYRHLSSLQS